MTAVERRVPKQTPGVTVREVRIPRRAGQGTLGGVLYLPSDITSPVPALVTVLPYRFDFSAGAENDATLRWFARRGYGSVLVDHSGVGSSDGRPALPWGEEEADDGHAVVAWAAVQPWSTGSVGMWGHSHGGTTALRVASRAPEPLRAVMPIMSQLKISDLISPGARRNEEFLLTWSGGHVLRDILPPLSATMPAAERERWLKRLPDAGDVMVDMLTRDSRDAAWAERAIDPSLIRMPTFCVGGWNDLCCAATLQTYKGVAGPKKLLMGPWLHTMPHVSGFDPLDFKNVALRWWDHWLKGAANGIMDEPPVTVFITGREPGWLDAPSWPPPCTRQERSTLSATEEPETDAPAVPVDFTAGSEHGCLTSKTGWGLPGDQLPDLRKSLLFHNRTDSTAGVLLLGCPAVRLTLLAAASAPLAFSLVEIGSDGYAQLLCCSIITCAPGEQEVSLGSIAHRLKEDSELALAVRAADFPRLSPITWTEDVRLRDVQLALEVANESITPARGLGPSVRSAYDHWAQHQSSGTQAETRAWRREGGDGRLTTHVTTLTEQALPLFEGRVRFDFVMSASVANSPPVRFDYRNRWSVQVELEDGRPISARVEIDSDEWGTRAHAVVHAEGTKRFERSWEIERAEEGHGRR